MPCREEFAKKVDKVRSDAENSEIKGLVLKILSSIVRFPTIESVEVVGKVVRGELITQRLRRKYSIDFSTDEPEIRIYPPGKGWGSKGR